MVEVTEFALELHLRGVNVGAGGSDGRERDRQRHVEREYGEGIYKIENRETRKAGISWCRGRRKGRLGEGSSVVSREEVD